MTNTEKAERILESLDEVFNVNWNFKKEYIDAITKALGDISKEERRHIETVV